MRDPSYLLTTPDGVIHHAREDNFFEMLKQIRARYGADVEIEGRAVRGEHAEGGIPTPHPAPPPAAILGDAA